MDEYEEMERRLMLAKNEKYVPDSTMLSAAVYDLWEGKKADSFFLYATDYVEFSEPFARLMIPCGKDEVVFYKSVKELPFREKCQVPKDLCPEELFEAYMESYMAIREFVFEEGIGESEKKVLQEYLEVFQRLSADSFSVYYMELAGNFMDWAMRQLGGA